MSIVEVEIVSCEEEILPPNMTRLLADRMGEIFGTAPGGTWVKVRVFPKKDYAENGVGASDTPKPVFVTVLNRDLREGTDLQQEVDRITHVVAEVCARPAENVHVIYQPAGAGRVAFWGRLI